MILKLWKWFLSFFGTEIAVAEWNDKLDRMMRDNSVYQLGGLPAGGNAHQRRLARRRFKAGLDALFALEVVRATV